MKKKIALKKSMKKAVSWQDRLWIKMTVYKAKLNGFLFYLRGKFYGR